MGAKSKAREIDKVKNKGIIKANKTMGNLTY
jgi:hypothetical protein